MSYIDTNFQTAEWRLLVQRPRVATIQERIQHAERRELELREAGMTFTRGYADAVQQLAELRALVGRS